MADAIKTLGTVLSMSTEVGSPQTFVAIGNLTDWSGPGASRNIIGTANLSSTAATKLGGLLDEGDFSFTVNFDPSTTSHQALVTAKDDGAIREFKYVMTDSGSAEVHFNGIVSGLSIDGGFDDKVTAQISVAVTGKAWITY